MQENSDQALKWYRKAVAQGSSKAQERIDVMSRRIDSNPRIESSSNTNSDDNLDQKADDNAGCVMAICIVIIFIFAIIGFSIGLSNTYEGDKKSSNYTTSNVVKDTSNRGPIKIGNLTWSSKAPNRMDWNDSVNYCKNLKEGGLSDWRLPNIDELRTLIQNHPGTQSGGSCPISEKTGKLAWNDRTSYCDGRLGSNFSKLGDTDWFWSSSAPYNSNFAWNVGFGSGGVVDVNEYSIVNNVRCVRQDQ